jgi:hypothetical protein
MMTYITVRERCRTFNLDQLLDARRRRVRICLNCADDSETLPTATTCIACGGPQLMSPDQIIATKLRGAHMSRQKMLYEEKCHDLAVHFLDQYEVSDEVIAELAREFQRAAEDFDVERAVADLAKEKADAKRT